MVRPAGRPPSVQSSDRLSIARRWTLVMSASADSCGSGSSVSLSSGISTTLRPASLSLTRVWSSIAANYATKRTCVWTKGRPASRMAVIRPAPRASARCVGARESEVEGGRGCQECRKTSIVAASASLRPNPLILPLLFFTTGFLVHRVQGDTLRVGHLCQYPRRPSHAGHVRAGQPPVGVRSHGAAHQGPGSLFDGHPLWNDASALRRQRRCADVLVHGRNERLALTQGPELGDRVLFSASPVASSSD